MTFDFGGDTKVSPGRYQRLFHLCGVEVWRGGFGGNLSVTDPFATDSTHAKGDWHRHQCRRVGVDLLFFAGRSVRRRNFRWIDPVHLKRAESVNLDTVFALNHGEVPHVMRRDYEISYVHGLQLGLVKFVAHSD
jgi:hypothetical protein